MYASLEWGKKRRNKFTQYCTILYIMYTIHVCVTVATFDDMNFGHDYMALYSFK